jgi:electron transfer flavoprotein alpha subunit
MANVLCVVELLAGRALPVSLEVLGQARRVSSALGATLYAVLSLPRPPSWSDDDLVATLAAHGADKVVIATDERLAAQEHVEADTEAWEEPRWGTHGAALAAVCDLLAPSLVLFGATPQAREVAARTAARIGAAYLIDAWVEADDSGLRLSEGEPENGRRLDGELEFAVVATVPPGRYEVARGDDEAEVEVVATSSHGTDFEQIGWESDPRPNIVVVSDTERRGAADRLARVLGAAVDAPGRPRLAIALGAPCPVADRRVRLGDGPTDCEYAIAGDADKLADALADALAEPKRVAHKGST